ncbi:hypothetical protein BDP27DRAFT_1418381 [Rhodocollybia butyracea]|uniref:Uncharacterized protein n=1 Tax=Rhodocollybia butyracea TaxID=206335 RepID=A0A9P5Q1T2_9AGAR|nr:hypothetical protein BDP27DRAFT_1418381 [Rhodocollybia butyracea]
MFLAHRWLGFVLLAVLISPVCGAPTPAPPVMKTVVDEKDGETNEYFYKVTVVTENGAKKEMVPFTNPSVRNRIAHLIFNLGVELKDGKGPGGKPIKWDFIVDRAHRGKTTDRVIFELQGGKSCPKISETADPADPLDPRKCSGYVVSINAVGRGSTSRHTRVGAVIIQNQDSLTVLDHMTENQISEYAKGQHWLEFHKFLKDFQPIARAMDASAIVMMSNQLGEPRDAKALLLGKTPKRGRRPGRNQQGPAQARAKARLPHPSLAAPSPSSNDAEPARPPSSNAAVPPSPHLPAGSYTGLPFLYSDEFFPPFQW